MIKIHGTNYSNTSVVHVSTSENTVCFAKQMQIVAWKIEKPLPHRRSYDGHDATRHSHSKSNSTTTAHQHIEQRIKQKKLFKNKTWHIIRGPIRNGVKWPVERMGPETFVGIVVMQIPTGTGTEKSILFVRQNEQLKISPSNNVECFI